MPQFRSPQPHWQQEPDKSQRLVLPDQSNAQMYPPSQYPPLQQRWQQPQYPTYPPPPQQRQPPKKRHTWRNLSIGCAAALVLALAFLAVAGAATAGRSTPTPATSSHPKAQPTHGTFKPTAQPTGAQATPHATPTAVPTHASATPTPIPTSSGPALLGAPLGTFIAKYGQPNYFSQPNHGMYFFSIYGKHNDDVTVMLLDGKHANAIIQVSPTNGGWNEATAIQVCLSFAPPDMVYMRQMTQGLGSNAQDIQRVYVSPTLAKLFPASDFTDENGNQTTPGTIGMILNYNVDGTPSFVECVLQIGLQAN